MKFSEFRRIAKDIAEKHNIDVEDVEFEVSLDPIEEGSGDVRYFGSPNELMEEGTSGKVMILVEGIKNE
jgi:hypothetical protein